MQGPQGFENETNTAAAGGGLLTSRGPLLLRRCPSSACAMIDGDGECAGCMEEAFPPPGAAAKKVRLMDDGDGSRVHPPGGFAPTGCDRLSRSTTGARSDVTREGTETARPPTRGSDRAVRFASEDCEVGSVVRCGLRRSEGGSTTTLPEISFSPAMWDALPERPPCESAGGIGLVVTMFGDGDLVTKRSPSSLLNDDVAGTFNAPL